MACGGVFPEILCVVRALQWALPLAGGGRAQQIHQTIAYVSRQFFDCSQGDRKHLSGGSSDLSRNSRLTTAGPTLDESFDCKHIETSFVGHPSASYKPILNQHIDRITSWGLATRQRS
jgi:hypothetical protein